MTASTIVPEHAPVSSEEGTAAPATRARLPLRQRVAGLPKRYEIVVATIAAIVLMTRLAGGGFIADRLGPESVADGAFDLGGRPGASTPGASGPVPTVAPFAPTPARSPAVYSFTPAVPDAPYAGSTAVASSGAVGQSTTFASLPSPGHPTALTVSPGGAIWVSSLDQPVLFQLAADGHVVATRQVSGITGGISALVAPTAGRLYGLARTPAVVLRIDPSTGSSEPYATIPDVGSCLPPVTMSGCDVSIVNQPPAPTAMAFDAHGALFVADAGQGIIWRVPAGGGEPVAWLTHFGWANPTAPAGPTGVAFDGAGNLVVAVQSELGDNTGAIYLVDVTDEGAAGTSAVLARTDSGSRPSGVAVGANGTLFVPLLAGGKVVVVGPDGKERSRLPADAAIDTPAGISFLGNDLLVAAQTPSDASGGRILRLPAGEAAGRLFVP